MNEEKAVQGSLEVSVVLPAYNEVNALETAVEKVTKALSEFASSYEIIIAEDGSTDGTDKLAASLAQKYPFVKHIHREKRLGRGAALKNAFNHSRGEILLYMDLDLAADLRHLKSLVCAVEFEGYEFATGSRLLPHSKVKRSGTRHIASKTYNFMVRAMLCSEVKDHQCGFKAFRREPLMQLLDEVKANHWFWDTELLVQARRRGYRIKEVPVSWTGGRETKVKVFQDSFRMGWQILSLWWHLKVQRYQDSDSFDQKHQRSGNQ